ncbi:MAG: glycosyltransferase family 2 protein [Syntrophobacteraceae bacterium]
MPNSGPIISVIVPTYSHGDFILESLHSVFAQTYGNYEIIVINDGSPDNTRRLLEPYITSGQIKYIEQANAGQGAARNRGLAEAAGAFIAFLDDDDLWPTDKLEWQLRELQTHPDAVLVYGFIEVFGDCTPFRHPRDQGPGGNVQKDLFRGNFLRSPGQTLIRSGALRRVNGFDSAIWGADDWDLWIRLARIGHFSYAPRLALRYRVHPSNASRDFLRMYRNGRSVIHKNLGPFPRYDTFMDWISSMSFIFVSLGPFIMRLIQTQFSDKKYASALVSSLILALFQVIGLSGKTFIRLIEIINRFHILSPQHR